MEIQQGLNKKFTSDSVITVAAILIIATCGLGINLIIQGNFNKDGLGIFSYILSIFFIVNSVGTLGMNRAMVYFSSFYNDNELYRNQLITNAILLVTVWSLILFCLLNLGLNIFSHNILTEKQSSYLRIVSFAIPFYCINNVALAVFNGLRRMILYSFLRSLRWISLVVCLILLSLNGSLESTFYSFIISEVIVLIIVVFFFLRAKYLTTIFQRNCFLEILGYIKYVYPSQILVSLNENMDIVIIENFVDDGSLGIYSLSSKVAKSLGLIGGAIQSNFNPIVSSYFKDNSIEKLKQFCLKLKVVSLKVFIPLIILLIIFYYLLLDFYIIDESYNLAFKYFVLQSFGAGIYAAFSWCGGMLIMTGKIKENIYRGIWKLFINLFIILFCVISFPLDYGIYIGFTLMMISQLFIDRLFISKYIGIKIF
jgi:O-antigen/teichoic acid export membrane protein